MLFLISAFISAAVAVCYMFLIVYTWVFLGDNMYFTIPFTNVTFKVLRPFASMWWLMGFYAVIAITSFIVWCVGSYLLAASVFCAVTSPLLYQFSSFLVISYWLGFSVVVAYLVKIVFGRDIAGFVKDATREHTVDEVEEQIFRKKFTEYDKERDGEISSDDLASLIQSLGVYVPDDEIPALTKTLDPDGSGKIKFNKMLAWFRKVNHDAEEKQKETDAKYGLARLDGGEDDDDDGDGGKSRKKK